MRKIAEAIPGASGAEVSYLVLLGRIKFNELIVSLNCFLS